MFLASPEKHGERVQEIQAKVREWNSLPLEEGKNKRPYMCTSRPNWLSLSTTFFNKAACHKVPIPLYDILSLDEKNMTVSVEPMVSVGDITRYLIPKGYTLAVTLEIADATLGGLGIMIAIETFILKFYIYLH
jgi:delta24-sterol reductase